MNIRCFIVLYFVFCNIAHANTTLEARKLFSRLTGKTATIHDLRIAQMANLLDNNDPKSAALIAINDIDYYDITLRGFASRLISIEDDPYIKLNDSISLLIGLAKDKDDFRKYLYGDVLYVPLKSASNNEEVIPSNNFAFNNFEKSGKSIIKNIVKRSPQWNISSGSYSYTDFAGVFTTRGWARIYYEAGTNRRSVKGAMNSFLCAPIDSWKNTSLPDYRIRRDVDRLPGGNYQTFQKTCRGCHAPMDAMGGAFANLNFLSSFGGVIQLGLKPEFKYNKNDDIYPDGYITLDSSWINFLDDENYQKRFGWKEKFQGETLQEYGKMLATSKAFTKCMTQKTLKHICKKDFSLNSDIVEGLSKKFTESKFKLNSLFVEAAIHDKCN